MIANARHSNRTDRDHDAVTIETRANAIDDVLVFEIAESGFSLIGGTGRGAGWAGIVDVGPGSESLVGRAWQGGTLIRHDSTEPAQIAGPYYARHAIAVPTGQRHVVLLGAADEIDLSDTEAIRFAAASVDQTNGVPADKLLADELELVHVIRALMAYRAENVRDTMRHFATIAAGALSCEVAMIRLEHEGTAIIETVGLDGPGHQAFSKADQFLAATGAAATDDRAVDHARRLCLRRRHRVPAHASTWKRDGAWSACPRAPGHPSARLHLDGEPPDSMCSRI